MRILDKNRGKYEHRFDDGQACPFCGTAQVIECEKLSTPLWRFLVNRYPYLDGNVMLVPRRHVEKTEDFTPEEWKEFGSLLVKTQGILSRVFKVDSFNIGLNAGPQSGASIPHLHWQVIPRKFKNLTAVNMLAEVYVVGVTPEETKRLIDAYRS